MINDHHCLTDSGIKRLKQLEGFRLEPYDDQSGAWISEWCGGATIGYGHLIAHFEWDEFAQGITEADADLLFQTDIKPVEEMVRRAICVPLKPHQFDALVMLAYNIGDGRFRTSSAVRMINDPAVVTSYVTLHDAWMAWIKSQGKVNHGLEHRRASEWQLWSSGAYAI
jgi:lysozyme